MANSKRMIEDLRTLALQDNIDAQAYRRLLASSIADLHQKVCEMCETSAEMSMEHDKILDDLCDRIKLLRADVTTVTEDMCELKAQIGDNPAIRAGKLYMDYPIVVKLLFAFLMLVLAFDGVQSITLFVQKYLGF